MACIKGSKRPDYSSCDRSFCE